jgi:hypothetical protein
MTGLATSTDLDPFESGDADAAIAWASEVVRDYCGQSIEQVLADVEICDPRPDFTVQLRQGPVTAVTLVEVRIPGPDGALAWTPVDTFEWLERGLVTVFGTMWPGRKGQVRVTYDHGFATVPESIKQVTLEIAAQKRANPLGLVYRNIGEKKLGFAPTTGAVLSSFQRDILDRYAVEEVS